MMKRALIYGALIALAGAALTFIMGAAGLDENAATSQAVGWLGFLFPVVGIVLAIRGAKREETGEFTFGEGFKQGALTALVAAALGAVFTYLYVTAINPDAIETMREAASAQLNAQGARGAQREAMEAMQGRMLKPGALSGIGFGTQLIIGLLVSVVAALFMRRKAPTATGDGYGG